jgi:predicted nucleic acid-binding protein
MAVTSIPPASSGRGIFLDTSVLLAGLIDFGPQSVASQQVLHAVAIGTVTAATAWHCCLEAYSVATRLPPEYRVSPADAAKLLREEIFARMTIHDLPPADRGPFLATLVQDSVTGGRIYDAHIAEVARAAGARVIVTDNRRHFLAVLRHGIRVETPGEFLSAQKTRR